MSTAAPTAAPAPLPPAPDPGGGRDLSEMEQDYLFDVYGYRILRGALWPDQLARMNAWVDRQTARTLEPGQWIGDVEVHTYGSSDGINFQNVMEADEPAFQELIDHPAWMPSIRRYIENDQHRPHIDECFLNVRQSGGYIPIHSGGACRRLSSLFRWHNGQWAVGQINILMALTDVGPGDGATTIVPSSHKANDPHPEMAGAWDRGQGGDTTLGMCEVHLNAGDVLMFTDGLCHGSTPRTNPGERRVCIYRYSPHLMVNRFNYIPSDEFLARLSPAQRKLVQPVPPRGRPGRTLTFRSGTGVGG